MLHSVAASSQKVASPNRADWRSGSAPAKHTACRLAMADDPWAGALLRELRGRHAAGQPYMWMGKSVLLATNPGRPLPALHGRAASQEAAQKGGGARMAAHVFAVAEQSARRAEQGEIRFILLGKLKCTKGSSYRSSCMCINIRVIRSVRVESVDGVLHQMYML